VAFSAYTSKVDSAGFSLKTPRAEGLLSRRGLKQGFPLPGCRIGPLRPSWALGEERIILALALMAHLRKRINAQRWAYLLAKQALYLLSSGPVS
jgi:hypothetical protein